VLDLKAGHQGSSQIPTLRLRHRDVLVDVIREKLERVTVAELAPLANPAVIDSSVFLRKVPSLGTFWRTPPSDIREHSPRPAGGAAR
jgi:hypothetical protein